MATTTPNYGWSVPTSSDYVAQGAVAIETLGDSVDASLFSITGGKNVGMVHLNTTTLTNASSATINNVFTSSYDSYMIIITAKSTGSTSDITMKLASGGTPTSSSGYAYMTSNAQFTTSVSWILGGSAGDSSGKTGTVSTLECSSTIFLHQPAAAKVKTWWHQGVRTDGFSTGGNGYANYTTAYDGIQFSFPTCNGQIRIYGLRNS
jgi:hypothetical protein